MNLSKEFTPFKKNGTFGYYDGVPFLRGEYEFLLARNPGDYRRVKAWVDGKLMPFITRKSFNTRHTSYGLKHVAEKELGFYVSNGEIKLALLENGVPFDGGVLGSPNPHYPLSENFFKGRPL